VLAEKAGLVRAAARSPDVELHLNPDVWAITSDRRRAVDAAAKGAGIDADQLDASAYVLAGSVEQVVDHLETLREATGISYVSIRSDQIDEFAPVVAALRGR
jgi:alkanesulfonate monooxygenase SsuD/methylene tetrahydromethanopterin reductase-like flavin-dependent oxidoreductase (luciferase family)